MKYMLLIQHGDTPTPGSPEWEAMSEDEKRGSPRATRPSTRPEE